MQAEKLFYLAQTFYVRNSAELNKREPLSLFKSVMALLLIIGCLWAAQWQYHRGVERSQRNNKIEARADLPPVSINEAVKQAEDLEWRQIRASGEFDSAKQILLRNRYFEGKYGFEVLTAFKDTSGHEFWVDRGWVQAAPTATVQPDLPPLPEGEVEISGRLRLDRSLPQGKIFAIPSGGRGGLISEANAQSSNKELGIDSTFYVDLLSGDHPELTPQVAAALPELSDGPHYAYALQWIIFGGLIIYGRILIRREVLTREEL
jgi:cytochrome oxidase assembly protein ShyY1